MDKLVLATEWATVERAATKTATCIMPGNANHDKAEEDWRQQPGLVEYWVTEDTRFYARVVRLTQNMGSDSVWLLDFARPMVGDYLVEVSKHVYGWLFIASYHGLQFPPEVIPQQTFLPPIVMPVWLKHTSRSFGEQPWLILQGKANPTDTCTRPLVYTPQAMYD